MLLTNGSKIHDECYEKLTTAQTPTDKLARGLESKKSELAKRLRQESRVLNRIRAFLCGHRFDFEAHKASLNEITVELENIKEKALEER